MKQFIQRYIDWVGLVIMAYFGLTAFWAILSQASPLAIVSYEWIWGLYSPFAYQVLLFSITYFLFHKKFLWLSPFMFVFVWGFNDMLYNIFFDLVHIIPLTTGHLNSQIPDGIWVYLMKMGIEAGIMLTGAAFLKLRFNMSFSPIKYMGLTLIVGDHIFGILSGLPQLSPASSLVFQFQAFTAILGLLMFLYTAVVSRAEDLEVDML